MSRHTTPPVPWHWMLPEGLDWDWMDRAACATAPQLPWTTHTTPPPRTREVMRQICAVCPVFDECDRFADASGATAGVWAGRSRLRSATPRRAA